MGQDLSLKVVLAVNDQGSPKVGAFGRILGGLSGPAGAVARGFGAITLAAIDLGAQFVTQAGVWQSSLTTLVTGAGEAQGAIGMVSDGMLNMAVDTGTTTAQLSAGMYQIESAGYHGAAGLTVLKDAAEGAKVGNADLGAVANGTTTALTDYGIAASKASNVVNDLIATVSNGKTTMQALSTSLSGILPVSSAAGVSLGDTSAAMATMTGEGVPAAQAATFLRQTILSLLGPSTAASKQLKEVGLTTQQIADEMKKSLPDALAMITDAVGKKFPVGSAGYIAALKTIVGGTKNLQGTLDLTGTHLSTFQGNVTSIAASVKAGGNSITGWALVQDDFNQKMDQAREVLETLQIRIGTALLPTISSLVSNVLPVVSSFATWFLKSGILQGGIALLSTGIQKASDFVKQMTPPVQTLVAAVIPVVLGFADWLVKSGLLKDALGFVSGVIKDVAGFALGLATNIAKVVGFFQNNQVAAAALLIPLGILGGYFVYLAVTAIASFIAAAPGMLAGFLMGASGAWAMAAGVLAATWPFLLIGAAIGLLIGIIVLLVTHWSQVVAFLQGVWAAFSSWFMGALGDIGAFFSGIWSGIVSGLQAAWGAIVHVVQAGLSFLLAVFLAPFKAIGALFTWLYDHNRYFQLLIDIITGIIQTGLKIVTDLWNRFTGWLVGIWNGLVGLATSAFTLVVNAIQGLWGTAIGIITGIWSKISSVFSGAWSTYVQQPVANMWKAVGDAFSGAWSTYVQKPLQGLWNSIVNVATGWPAQAAQWGANLINGFINGIKNMVGQLGQQLNNVGNTIKNFLGFHSPTKMGPGAEADLWPKGLIDVFVNGLQANQPRLNAVLNTMFSPMAIMQHGTGNPPAGFGGTIPYGQTPMSSTTMNNSAGGYTHNGDIVIHAPNGSNPDAIAQAVMDQLNRKYRRSGLMGNLSAGGRSS